MRSQDKNLIDDLYANVKKLEHADSLAEIKHKKRLSGRKYLLTTHLHSEAVIKTKVKYFKSGLKREETKYYTIVSNEKNLRLSVVKINGVPEYIEYNEITADKFGRVKILSREILVNGRFYTRYEYNKDAFLTVKKNILRTDI